MQFIKNILGVTSSNIWSLFVYMAIVFVFIVALLLCIMPVVHTRGKLRAAIHQLKKGDKAKRSWQEDGFLGKGSLMAHWSAYLNNLFFADGTYHNASNVEDFINEETVIYGPGRSAFTDAVPSLLTSIGFLGTLIGLAQGLSGFDMTDSTTVQNSIMVLIPGMKYAFMTSIFGVIGSVTFTLLTRAIYGSTENTLRMFYGAMSRNAGVLSVDPLTQVAIYQQEQTDLIRTLISDLNGKFTDNISGAVSDAVEPINQNLRAFMTVTSKEQMRFLDQVVQRFIDHMDDALGGRLSGLSATLDATTRKQKEILDSVGDSLQDAGKAARDLRSMQTITNEMVESLNSYISQLKSSRSETDELYSRLSGTAEKLDLVSKQQAAYLKTITGMQTEITSAVNAMTNEVNGFMRRFSESNTAATNAMQKTAGELSSAANRMESAQKAASKALDADYKTTMDAYRDYVNQFTKRVDYLAGGIADALNTLPKAVDASANRLLDQVDALSQALMQAQDELNRAIDRMYGRR